MRHSLSVLGFGLSVLLGACGGAPPSGTAPQNSAGNPSQGGTAQGTNAGGAGGAAAPLPGVSSAHGGPGGGATVNAAPPEKPPIDTAELDARIEKAASKAKAPGATAADRKAAVEAYLARGNVYWSAGDKRLYRYALGDFRRVLRYQPDNEEAREKIATIESIYESLGRPVPGNGLEP